MPEAFIVHRYKYDIQKRIDFFGDFPTSYDNIDQETSRMTPLWWEKFNTLTHQQRTYAEKIIAENSVHDEDIKSEDEQVTAVLRYYQVSYKHTSQKKPHYRGTSHEYNISVGRSS